MRRLYLLAIAGLVVAPLPECNQMSAERSQVVTAARQVSTMDAARLAGDIRRDAAGNAWWKGEGGTSPVERGIVLLGSGQVVRFGFLSHHLSADRQSHAYFETDGYRRFVTGFFCCGVDFGERARPADMKALDAYLTEMDGVPP